MAAPTVKKARIVQVDNPSKEVKCHFNPSDFEIVRDIKWEESTSIGNDSSEVSFAGGQANDLTIPLLFDTTDTGKDVRNEYKNLIGLSEVDSSTRNSKTDKGEPPRCRFEWGSFLSFTAVITQIKQKFTMFKADGTPLRAQVSVTFKQVEEKPAGQNPTSRSDPRRVWMVHEGQTLDWIAYKEYGDPAEWRHIAEVNGLMNPRDLTSGQLLKLTPLD